jgi:serine protease Do
MTRTFSRALAVAAALAVASPLPALAQGKDVKPAAPQTTKTTSAPSPEKVAKAKEFSEAITAVAEKVSPSVVQIDVAVRDESSDAMPWWMKKKNEGGVLRGNGSGVLISSDGYVLTNNHVVEDAIAITVKTKDGKIFSAKIKGRDPSTDLAVLKVDGTGLTASKLGDSDAAKVGEWVVAVGSPFGFAFSVTSGVLSAKGRGGLGMNAIEDYLQTDASINPGNSGGPLVNLNGEVIGINTMILGKYGSVGLGFAVPSNMAKRVADQIIKNGKVTRAWLGVGVQDLTPDLAKAMKVDAYAGALINDTVAGGPAFNAKVVPGDIVAKVAGKPVKEAQDLIREVINHDVGSTITLEVIRNGKVYQSNAVLTARPEPPVKPTPLEEQKGANPTSYGITMKPIPGDSGVKLGFGKAATYISYVEPNSPADKAGMQPGDVILEATGSDGKTTANPNTEQMIKIAGGKGQLLMRVGRKDARFFVVLTK